jgi:hypothetical protein
LGYAPWFSGWNNFLFLAAFSNREKIKLNRFSHFMVCTISKKHNNQVFGYDFNLSKHRHWSLYSVGQYNNIIIKPLWSFVKENWLIKY